MFHRRPVEGIPAGITAHDQPLMPEWIEALAPVLWIPPESLEGTAADAAVATWPDWSDATNDAVQGTGSLRPLYRLTGGANGHPNVEFDATDDYLNAAFALAQPEHIFIVAKKGTPTANNPTLVDGGAGTGNRMRIYWAGAAPGSDVQVSMTSDAVNVITANGTFTSWFLLEAQFNGATSKLRINGGTYTIGNAGTNGGGGIRLSNFGSTGAPGAVRIHEVLLLDAIASQGAADLVTEKLMEKYAL